MPAHPSTIRVELWVPDPEAGRVLERLVGELRVLSPRAGARFDLRPGGGVWSVEAAGTEREIAVVESWEPGRRVKLAWSPFDWDPEGPPLVVELEVRPADGGTTVTLACGDFSQNSRFREPDELIGWFASGVVRSLALAVSSDAMAEWWTDRVARRPTGPRSKENYAEPLYHLPNFLVILERLKLTPADRLLEVGCGGGAFLRRALASGCRAMAVDHSPDMVETALETNREAVREGRLEVRDADVGSLPFPDASCSCAVSTGVLHFIADPARAMREIRRVLRPGGRLVLFTGASELRGTPAAPEPMASRLHWYDDGDLAELARQAGFVGVRVDRPDFVPYARAAGLPEDAVAFFASVPRGGQVLEARAPPAGP